jgi:hypothetical protein
MTNENENKKFKCAICDDTFEDEERGLYDHRLCLKCEFWDIYDKLPVEKRLEYLENRMIELLIDILRDHDIATMESEIESLKCYEPKEYQHDIQDDSEVTQ